LAIPQKSASTLASPPLAPQRSQAQVPAFQPNLSGAEGTPFQYLDQLSLDGWQSQPLLVRRYPANQKATPNEGAGAGAAGAGLNAPDCQQENLDLTMEFGCNASAQKAFVQGPRRIVASIWQFPTSEGAFGAYCCLRKGSSNFIARGDASSEDDHCISFWKDLFFVSVQASTANDEDSMAAVSIAAKQLADAIIKRSPKPMILTYLPSIERVQGSEKIVMGPIALKRFFPAPFIGSLATDAPLKGVVADYQQQEPHRERLKLLVAIFASPASASLSFSKYTGLLQENHNLENADGFAYQTSVFKIANKFILCQMRGNQLVIITGAHKKNSLASLANAVY
jgi:hypothetical protein